MMSHEEGEAWRPEIHGWSTDILPWYKARVETLPQNPRIVEVGIYRGRSLLFLAEELTAKRGPGAFELVGVDPLMWEDELWSFLAENWRRMPPLVGKHVRLVRLESTRAARAFEDESVDLVFIDGEHDEANVRADIQAWLPKVKPGGILSGHDYGGGHPGVPAAVNALIGAPPVVTVTGTVWEWKKGG